MTIRLIVVISGSKNREAKLLNNTDADSTNANSKRDRHHRVTYDFIVGNGGDQAVKGKFQGKLDGAVEKAVLTFLEVYERQGLKDEKVIIWEPKRGFMQLVPQNKILPMVKEVILKHQDKLCG